MTTRPGYIKDSLGNWIQIGPVVPVGSTVYYQASEPASPATGDIWIDSDYDVPSVDSSQFLRWRKTAVGGETSLSGNDDTGLSLSYTPGYEQVYLNGVLLVRSQDYTATTGTTITGLTALAASDVVEVFSVLARVVGDVYTQSQSDNKYSPITTTGLVLVNTTNFTSVSSVSIDNVFTSSYQNYIVNFEYDTSGSNLLIYLRFRSAGTDNTTSNYNWQTFDGYGSTVAAFRSQSQNTARIINTFGELTYADIHLYAPQANKPTFGKVSHSYGGSTTSIENLNTNFGFSATTQFDGLTLYPASGTMTGTIKIYGYK